MNIPVYVDLSILEISKILICEFWYDYVKLKYRENAKVCCMDTDIFLIYIETGDIHVDISKDVETKHDTSNYELDRSSPKGKDKKVIGLMKDELGGKIITEFSPFR